MTKTKHTKKRVPVNPALYYFDDDQHNTGSTNLGAQEPSLVTLQQETAVIRQSSLQSTRRMLTYCHEATQKGAQTVEMLAVQGEQLNRVETAMDGIDSNLKEAKKNIREMERSIWRDLLEAFCCCCCGRRPRPSTSSDDDSAILQSKSWLPLRSVSKIFTTKTSSEVLPPPATLSSGHKLSPIKEEEVTSDEVSANLDVVNHFLGGLKNMAQDMNEEITRQNDQLDELNVKALRNDAAMMKAKKSMEKML